MLISVCICMLVVSNNSLAFCLQSQETKAEIANKVRSKGLTNDIIKRLLAEVPTISDPTLRVFTRLQMAKHLITQASSTNEPDSQRAAKTLVTDALDDVTVNQSLIPASYSKSFRHDIFILLRKYWPDLAPRLIGEQRLANEENDLSLSAMARLFDDKATSDLAAGIVRNKLRKRFDPYELFYLVNNLEKRKHSYLPVLLNDILDIAVESANTGWVESFSMLYGVFLSYQQAIELKVRFCDVVIKIVSKHRNWADTEDVRYAYGLLTNISSFIEILTPGLKSQARAQESFLASRLPKSTIDQIAIDKSILEDPNTLGRLVNEAKAAKNEPRRSELLNRAADMALKKGELQIALDIVIDLDDSSRELAQRKDMLLLDIVSKALEMRQPDMAQKACARTISKLSRSSALEKIGMYHATYADPQRARESLSEALLLVGAIGNDIDRTIGLFRLTQALLKADESNAPQVLKEAVGVINDIPGLKSQRGDMRESDVQDLITLSYNLSPAFKLMAQKNDLLALNIADTISSEWLKAQALLAIRIGLQEGR